MFQMGTVAVRVSYYGNATVAKIVHCYVYGKRKNVLLGVVKNFNHKISGNSYAGYQVLIMHGLPLGAVCVQRFIRDVLLIFLFYVLWDVAKCAT